MGRSSSRSNLTQLQQVDETTPDCECCTPAVGSFVPKKLNLSGTTTSSGSASKEWKELVIIGAGPHALSLVLRLLEADADLMSDKERHIKADFQNRMRPYGEVRNHVKNLSKGPTAIYKKLTKRNWSSEGAKAKELLPPVSLEFLKEHALVIDGNLSETNIGIHGWLAGWTENFDTLNIEQLRSPISAHADPYDHRSLEFFAYRHKRDEELVPLDHLTKMEGRWDFHGPYNAPTTKLFADFNKHLITGYGIQDMVRPGFVQNIRAMEKDEATGEPYFELSVSNPDGTISTVYSRRLVCAMGPAQRKKESLLDQMLLEPWQLSQRVLQSHEIVPFLTKAKARDGALADQSILIVGGGITSAHLALLAVDNCHCSWCQSVTLIQRSKALESQFDIDTCWMGPGRGKKLDGFLSLPIEERAAKLKEVRRGGSISPELVQLLKKAAQKSSSRAKLVVEEETQIMHVEYDWYEDKLLVTMDSGLPAHSFDMIWLATGFENCVCNYPALTELLSEDLPVELISGLPVLGEELNLKEKTDEPDWKQEARKNLYLMGPLAGLQLGPDALNLMGARQGAVRVAKALRADIASSGLVGN